MTAAEVLVFFVKAFFVVMFGMNVGVLLTWADRRQGAMIQDRVGPNRAVLWIPRKVAQVLAAVPALIAAGGVLALAALDEVQGDDRTSRAEWFTHAAILLTWVTALVIASRVQRRGPRSSFDRFIKSAGNPRRIVYAGLGCHLVALVLAWSLPGTEAGDFLRELGYRSGPALTAFAILFGAGYSVYSVRKERRVGLRLAGLLHPAADGLKTLFKEDFIPPNADRLLHSLAPIISFFPALVVLAVVPFGDTLCFDVGKSGKLDFEALGHVMKTVPADGVCGAGAVPLQVVDLNVGILYFFALAGTGIVGAALAGWASDNKFSLLGGLRAASQMVSYEVTLGLTLIGALMIYGTLRIDAMVRWQAENAWGIFVQPLAFFLFFAAAVAESKRIPFDIPEGESEIVAGYFTEYAGMKFAMFFFSEYIAVVSSSALMVAIFLGGWHVPFFERDGIRVVFGEQVLFEQSMSHVAVILLGVLAFISKTVVLCWVQLTIRWTLPRFRYDQLMRLGWRKLLPTSLVNILATGLVMLAIGSAGASVVPALNFLGDLTMGVVALAEVAAVVALFVLFMTPAKKRRLIASSSARFAQLMGGTRTARMGA